MEGGIVAIKCIEEAGLGWLGTIPPLGTVNEDLKLTIENAETACIAGTYKQSQAYLGRFERWLGKMGIGDSEDQESSDNNDVESGRDKSKGYENITMQLELTRENSKNRIEGAAKGKWNFEDIRGYSRFPTMRYYELIMAFGPDVQSLDFTTAEMLRRYIGVKIERKEMEYGNPNKFRVPIFAKRCIHLPNWAEPTAQDLFTIADTVATGTNVSVDNQVQSPDVFHTRLKAVLSAVTTPGILTISGTNFFGEPLEEAITIANGASTIITKGYFNTIAVNGIQYGAVDGGTLQLTEHDCKIIPT